MRRTTRILPVVTVALFVAACSSGGSSKSSGSATTLPPLPASDLWSLIAFPPAPFEPVTDAPSAVLELGNKDAKEVSLPFTNEAELSKAGFQRGWESVFGTPDGAVVIIDVLAFATPAGPIALQKQFLAHAGPQRRTIKDVPAVVELGRSPKGRAALSTAFAAGRFLVVITVGGPPDEHDYTKLMNDLVHEQAANLP